MISPTCQSHGLLLLAMGRLLRLRLALAEFCLAMLEQHCEEKKHQALNRDRKTSAEIALEEFTRCTPEPNSIEQVRDSAQSLKTWAKCEILHLLMYVLNINSLIDREGLQQNFRAFHSVLLSFPLFAEINFRVTGKKKTP